MTELLDAYMNRPIGAELLGLLGGFAIGWIAGRLRRWAAHRKAKLEGK